MVKKFEKEEPKKSGKPDCTEDHKKEYQKQHEKGKYPRRVWPTDSEAHNKKGPKI